MTKGGETPTPRSWAHPGCPECGTDVFVDQFQRPQSAYEFECQFCGCRFTDAEGLSDRDLEQRRGGV